MHKLIIILFISILIFACSQEAEEAVDKASDAVDAVNVTGDRDEDADYAKKYGAAMKKAMAAKKEAATTETPAEEAVAESPAEETMASDDKATDMMDKASEVVEEVAEGGASEAEEMVKKAEEMIKKE